MSGPLGKVLRVFQVPDLEATPSAAMLLLRVVCGVAFMFHGSMKIRDPFGWMGPDPLAPAPFQALAAVAEFGGGLAWILGLLTPLATLGIACTMTVAIYVHAVVRGDPFVSMVDCFSYEVASLFFCIAMVLLAIGPGRYSLDRAIFGRRPGRG